ncbi:MAG TPA: bifunctional shikimate kinase/3-dehydroquinate synthase [Actinomycetota bacterium]|nr:bifunctional shikimate kinase/3-dehydroquinate synthase [Actinomycetota bacterium]
MKTTHLPAPPLPKGRPNLVVTGFMGTGKSSSGRYASRLLGLPFVDLDEVIAERAGASVADIFAHAGEAGFRALERSAVADAARLSGSVVATGGGAVLDAASFSRIAQGAAVAVLTCEPDEIVRRVGATGGRPLLDGDSVANARALLDERAAAYERAGPALDTTGLDVAGVGAALAARYREAAGESAAVRIPVDGPAGTYPVVVGETLDKAGAEVRAAVPAAHRVLVLADRSVDTPLGDRVAASLASEGLVVERFPLPPGEAAKSVEVASELWARFVALGVDRTCVVVAVGGGGGLDAAGFVAATYARGIPLVNVPTTLLAMADASLGGKTAIDHGGSKNSVGAFHHPSLVLADPAALETVPARDLRGGLAEIVKMAATASPLVLDLLQTAPLDERSLPTNLGWLVEQAVRMKAAYVGEDPGDLGLRHTLNLGHTIAHGVEASTEHAVPHGEAVAIGLVAESRYGEFLGVTSPGTAERLEALLRRFELPVGAPPGLDAADVLARTASDKKRRGGRAVVIVPAPGGAEMIEDADVGAVLSFLRTGVAS